MNKIKFVYIPFSFVFFTIHPHETYKYALWKEFWYVMVGGIRVYIGALSFKRLKTANWDMFRGKQ
jgi:hypothetical protein